MSRIRNKRLDVWMTEEEIESVRAAAKEAKISLADYILGINKCGPPTIKCGPPTIKCGPPTIINKESQNSIVAPPDERVPNDAVQPRVPKVRSDKHKGSWVQARREGRFKGTYEDYYDSMERY